MIEEPPLLRLKATRRRPSASQIAAFDGVMTGFVTDAMGGRGALPMAIKPIGAPDMPDHFVGVALTAQNAPGDILGTMAALAHIQTGDVLVAAHDGFQGCSTAGDRVVGMAKNSGAVAFVSDGPVRDLSGLKEVHLPVFATGLTPNSPNAKATATMGFPVAIGSVAIGTGDILIGDPDGVVVVPFAMIDIVIQRLEHIKVLEAKLDAEVLAGRKVPEAMKALLDSPQAVTTDEP